MADREKVIAHFKDAIEASGDNNKWRFVRVDVINDALELLKEHEPAVMPIPYQQDTSIGFFAGFKCGACNAVVFPDYIFCPMCGKAVKWK